MRCIRKGGNLSNHTAPLLIQTGSFHILPQLQQYGVMVKTPMEVQSSLQISSTLVEDEDGVGGGEEEGKTYNLCPAGRPAVKVICSNF